jgi:hypothetical protein
MNPFGGLRISEMTGTILALNHRKESEDSKTDKAKPRAIVGRLCAETRIKGYAPGTKTVKRAGLQR